jgi:hypothetical protein
MAASASCFLVASASTTAFFYAARTASSAWTEVALRYRVASVAAAHWAI